MSDFRDFALIKMDVYGRSKHRLKYLVVVKWRFGEMIQEPILKSIDVASAREKRRLLDALALHLQPRRI